MQIVLPLLPVLLLAACATPEVAEDYETKVFVPAELMAALSSDDPAVRADAALQVESMDPEERRGVLTELSKDDRATVRLMAVSQLAKKHAADDGVAERIAEVLSLDAEETVRIAAVGGLAASGRVEGLEALVMALSDDPSLNVRRAAGDALDRVTGKTFASGFSSKVGEAEDAADDAMMEYDDWLESNRASVRWTGTRFETGGNE